jgi:hypothetical protein
VAGAAGTTGKLRRDGDLAHEVYYKDYPKALDPDAFRSGASNCQYIENVRSK